MPLRFSTGRRSRVKHATGADPDKIARARRRHPRPRYATGEDASIAHFTGKELDYRKWAQEEDGSDDRQDAGATRRLSQPRAAVPRTPKPGPLGAGGTTAEGGCATQPASRSTKGTR